MPKLTLFKGTIIGMLFTAIVLYIGVLFPSLGPALLPKIYFYVIFLLGAVVVPFLFRISTKHSPNPLNPFALIGVGIQVLVFALSQNFLLAFVIGLAITGLINTIIG